MLQLPNLRLPTTVTKHFYADGLQVARMVGSGVYYLHEDALGSVRLETTTTVTVKFSSNYVPYGSNYQMTGKEVFMYIGQPYSSVTGLYYFGARYYDPTIGRFITEDSYGGDDNDPMTLNRYIYGRDNPERYVDPNGHMLLVAEGGGGSAPPCNGSPDACLTSGGDNQYGPPPSSSTTTSTPQTQHTLSELLGAFIYGGRVPPLDGIPTWAWPLLSDAAKGLEMFPLVVAELLLPSIVKYDTANHLTQYQYEDTIASGVLAGSIASVIGGIYLDASIVGFEFGSAMISSGILAGDAVGVYALWRLSADPELVETVGSELGVW